MSELGNSSDATAGVGAGSGCSWTVDDFWAKEIIPTGAALRLVRVKGEGVCPCLGFTVSLEHGNPGTPPDPTRLVLQIAETRPDICVQVITPATVDQTFEISGEVTTVAIRHVGEIEITPAGGPPSETA